MAENIQWLLCPICQNKTRVKIREDTEIKNFPFYCPKCKQETIVDVKKMQVFVCKSFESDFAICRDFLSKIAYNMFFARDNTVTTKIWIVHT